MNLFNILPDNYFAIFSGKNRAIYIESLITLYNLFEEEEALITKNDFVKTLKDKNKDLVNFSFADEVAEDDDENLILDSLSSKASFVVRRLEETGWIDVALDPESFEETIVLPPYSVSLLKAFKDIIIEDESPYVSLVHATYSELKLEDEEQDELLYSTLERAYQTTKKLKLELMTITHSIRIYQNRLSKTFQTNNVLHDYFDLYKHKVGDRYYHPLKTFDSVARFKRPINRILSNWMDNAEIRTKLINQACLLTHNEDKGAVENNIATMINYIQDTYDTINNLINNIDKENNNYTKASANKILYLNNTDKTIKGHLENIFKHYGKNINNGHNLSKILSSMQDSLAYFEQGYIDPSSVTLPILKKFRDESDPLKIVDFGEIDDLMMQNFLNGAMDNFTDEVIYDFVDSALTNRDEILAKDIPLIDEDAFIMLIIAVVKQSQPDCFYTVSQVDNTRVNNHGYLIPNLVFKRKEEGEN